MGLTVEISRRTGKYQLRQPGHDRLSGVAFFYGNPAPVYDTYEAAVEAIAEDDLRRKAAGFPPTGWSIYVDGKLYEEHVGGE